MRPTFPARLNVNIIPNQWRANFQTHVYWNVYVHLLMNLGKMIGIHLQIGGHAIPEDYVWKF